VSLLRGSTISNFFYLNHGGIVLQKERNREQFARARDGECNVGGFTGMQGHCGRIEMELGGGG